MLANPWRREPFVSLMNLPSWGFTEPNGWVAVLYLFCCVGCLACPLFLHKSHSTSLLCSCARQMLDHRQRDLVDGVRGATQRWQLAVFLVMASAACGQPHLWHIAWTYRQWQLNMHPGRVWLCLCSEHQPTFNCLGNIAQQRMLHLLSPTPRVAKTPVLESY